MRKTTLTEDQIITALIESLKRFVVLHHHAEPYIDRTDWRDANKALQEAENLFEILGVKIDDIDEEDYVS